jgi:hypothetical protein
MKRFLKIPVDLFRVQTEKLVSLKSFDKQRRLGFVEYDVDPINSLIFPTKYPSKYKRPNGMQLLPMGEELVAKVVSLKDPYIFKFKAGTILPPEFCIYEERDNVYSLQTTMVVEFAVLNANLTKYLQRKTMWSRNDFLDVYQQIAESYLSKS